MKNCNRFTLNKKTVFYFDGQPSKAINHCFDMIFRDMRKIFGEDYTLSQKTEGADVIVSYADGSDQIYDRQEAYSIRFDCNGTDGKPVMHISGTDDLGIVYGLLYISTNYLGVDPFWFWMDKEPQIRQSIEILPEDFISPQPRVRYRGWFVNDEVCLIGWTDVYPPPKEVWYPVFEALLRCGGNMVIPGTDLPRTGINLELASEMGLYITHHHAEPLGAEMFFRAYPDMEASFDKNGHLFEGLWREAIEKQKNKRVVWVVGFRGQGDCPFWEQDPSCDTPEKRGKLIEQVIRRQVEILSEYVENPVCATYLYGEITELYRDGLIQFPEGVIKVWADNGYGKMVSRRNGNYNPRVDALPTASEKGPHGLYYHVTFHDLQASNHLTMFPTEPGLIKDELIKSFDAGTDKYLLLNCGNIRQHVYFLDIVSKLWLNGTINLESHRDEYCRNFFTSAWNEARDCLNSYFESTIKYGSNYDDRAGDEFYHHPARSIAGHWMRGETSTSAEDLIWAAGSLSFGEQVRWFYEKSNLAINGWDELKERCVNAAAHMNDKEALLFRDFLLCQVRLHNSGCRGLKYLCKSYFEWEKEKYPAAFVYASEAIWQYEDGLRAMEAAEHDKWKNFYRADWLTNVKITIYSLDALRKYLRVFGDNPNYFSWYKEYIMPETEKKIYLENTHRNPRSDDELAKLLKEKLKLN